MANRKILLQVKPQGIQTDEYLDGLFLCGSDVSHDREILSRNPFVKFIENPCFIHVMFNPDTKQIETKQTFVETYAGDVMSRVNSRDNKNKMFYILPHSEHEISQKGPTLYNPMNFMPLEPKMFTRIGEVKLTDRQVEELIFEHEYINYDILNDDVKYELVYFKESYGNDPFSPYPTVTKRLMSTKYKLSEKAYKVYTTLIERTRIPNEETFNRWLKRLEKIDTINNDYMYILIRR
jgi:hypothetical protein